MPRPQEQPKPDDVLDLMTPCEPYTAGELAESFDADRKTIWRRLHSLRDDGEVNKKKHSQNRVTWWIEPTEDTTTRLTADEFLSQMNEGGITIELTIERDT